MKLQDKFEEYCSVIDSIDNSQAKTDDYGNLAWHVDCSAQANVTGNTLEEKIQSQIDTAKMIIDCWEDFYPHLVKTR